MKLKYINRILLIALLLEIVYFVFFANTGFTLSMLLALPLPILFYLLYLKTKKDKYIFFTTIAIITCMCFSPYLSSYRMFCFDNDQYTQYEFIYNEWKRLIDNFINNGSFPFYSFNSFLGNNYYASKAFHLTGDVLYPIMLIFPTVVEGFAYQAFILTSLSSVFMYKYLCAFGIKNKKVIYITTLFFVFGGLSVNYISPISWRRSYALLPLIFYAIENYRETHKTTWISIVVFIGFITNCYFMFPITVFAVVYLIFSCYYHYDEIKIGEILKTIPKAILGYVVGFMLSCFIMIPTILFMANNPRVGSGISLDLFYNIKIYLSYFFNMLIDKKNALYDNFFTVNDNGHLSQVTGYINSLIVPCVLSYFFVGKSNQKMYVMKWFVIICILIPLSPTISSIMHGFSGPSFRWLFLPAMIFLLSFAVFFDQEKVDSKLFLKGLILCTIFFVICTCTTYFMGIIDNFWNYTMIASFLAVLLNYIYYILLKKNKIDIALISSSCLCVLSFCITLVCLNHGYDFYKDSLNRDVLEYISDIDEDKFYRIEINPYKIEPYVEPLNLNQSLNYNYKSVSGYDSEFEGSLSEFLEMNNIYNHIIRITNPECLRML